MKVKFSGCTKDLIQRYLYWFGIWEPQLTTFILARMKESPSRVFVDIGSNIGYFSLLVARHCPTCNVVAIEPYPATFNKLNHHLAINCITNVKAIGSAVADKSGHVNLFFAGDNNEGATSIYPASINSNLVCVPCSPLPQLLASEEINSFRLIKIDVEGAESSVVRGMAKMIDVLPLDAEFVIELSSDAPEGAVEIFDYFLAKGFFCYLISNSYSPSAYLSRPKLTSMPRLNFLPSEQVDVIFSRINTTDLHAKRP